MIRKIMLTLLSSLFWAPHTFAMAPHMEQENRMTQTRQHAAAPSTKLDDLPKGIRQTKLVLFLLDEDYDSAQFLCSDRAQATTGEISQLFREAHNLLSNAHSIKYKLPAHLLKLAPYLETDVSQSVSAHPTHVEQNGDPLAKLENHPLIQLIKNGDYDAVQGYCTLKAQEARSAGNSVLADLFTRGDQVFSNEQSIRSNLQTYLTELVPHLLGKDSVPLHPRMMYTIDSEEFARRMKKDIDAFIGTKAAFPRDLATEINRNFDMTPNDEFEEGEIISI